MRELFAFTWQLVTIAAVALAAVIDGGSLTLVTNANAERGVDPKLAVVVKEIATSVMPNDRDAGKPPLRRAARLAFIVGDSTMVEAAAVAGFGSAIAGLGFTAEAQLAQNPLLAPPRDFDGIVVMGVSVWDELSSDVSGYRDATDHYRNLGFDVVWIEVPPTDVPYSGGPLDPGLDTLNEMVADHLGCELQLWKLRDVESYGFAAGDPDGDWIHPTPRGGHQIAANAAALTAEHACVPRGDDALDGRGNRDPGE